jgi:hypothetical protein
MGAPSLEMAITTLPAWAQTGKINKYQNHNGSDNNLYGILIKFNFVGN